MCISVEHKCDFISKCSSASCSRLVNFTWSEQEVKETDDKVLTVFTRVFQLHQFKQEKINTGMSYSLSHIMKRIRRCHQQSLSMRLFLVAFPLNHVCHDSLSPNLHFHLFAPPSSGCGAAHPDRPPPLQRGAAAGQCHGGVFGQRGLPLGLEAGLEGGGQRHLLRGVNQPGGPGQWQPLQLDQHPEPQCRPVEEGGLSELWGRSEWTEPCHSNPLPWPLLTVEFQQKFPIWKWCCFFDRGRDEAVDLLSSDISMLSTQCFNLHVAF